MTNDELNQIKDELRKISPWPWKCGAPLDKEVYVGTGTNIENGYNFGVRVKDGPFIALAPTRIDALAREVTRLREALKYYANRDIYNKTAQAWDEMWNDSGKIAREALEDK